MLTHQSYQVGGSLPLDHPTYVTRRADDELFQAIQQGEFCHVLEPHQMGKSSLRLKTRQRLEQSGYRCAAVQATEISFESASPYPVPIKASPNASSDDSQRSLPWDKQLIALIWDSLNPSGSGVLSKWLKATDRLSPQRRLDHFVRDLLFPELLNQPLVIFIDEVGCFSVQAKATHQLFSWIERCYAIRDSHGEYHPLSFVILGSTTVSTLTKRAVETFESTPENMQNALETATRNAAIEQLFARACAITLEGFKLHQTYPLFAGLADKFSSPVGVLQQVLDWTNGQPFLTQRLCQLVAETAQTLTDQASRQLARPDHLRLWIKEIVRSQWLQNWSVNDDPMHLRVIRDRIHLSPRKAALIELYNRIASGQQVYDNGSELHAELLVIGLVIRTTTTTENNQQQLKVANKIYAQLSRPLQRSAEQSSADQLSGANCFAK